jgi:hypothetical protein
LEAAALVLFAIGVFAALVRVATGELSITDALRTRARRTRPGGVGGCWAGGV